MAVQTSTGPARMRAVILQATGDADVVNLSEIPTPQAEGDEIRVRIRAFGINRADVKQRLGDYGSIPGAIDARIPGLEYAGDIESIGPRVRGRKIGERVFGITTAGAYAEYMCINERMAMPIPDVLNYEEAASIPETYFTAFDALEKGRFAPGGSAIVHAVGSGVGVAGMQLVSAAGGLVIGTSRSRFKLDTARKYGMTDGALLDEPWDQLALDRTGGRGVDVILDFIGVSTYARNCNALRPDGCIVQIAELAGSKGEIDFRLLKRKRASLIGTQLRPRPVEDKIAITQRFERLVVPQFISKQLRPIVDKTFDFNHISDAHRYMEEDRNFGKIVVRIA